MTECPPGWEVASIADLIDVDGHFGDGDWVERKDQDQDGDVRLTQLADIGVGSFRDRSNRFLTSKTAAELGCTYLEPGDVLLARMPDPLGRACLFPGDLRPCVTAVDVCIIRPGCQSVEPRWLMWSMNAPQFRREILARQAGTTRKRISRKNLASIDFPVPPLLEQRRIVAAIEEQFSRLDAAETYLRNAGRKLENLRAAAIAKAFSGDWSWTTLGEIAEIAGGITKDTKRQNDPSFVEVPYLRVANVQRGFLDLRDVATIRVPPEKARTLTLRSGDVLFNEGGDRDKLGRGWVWSGEIEDCIHQNHVFRARLGEGFEPKFVSWHGNTFGQSWFEEHGRQTTNLASLNLTTLKSFPVPAPPLDEQREIVADVERQLTVEDSLTAEIDRALRRSATVRRSVLERAFTGRLVAQDPTDEPASTLVDRIAAARITEAENPRSRRRVPT